MVFFQNRINLLCCLSTKKSVYLFVGNRWYLILVQNVFCLSLHEISDSFPKYGMKCLYCRPSEEERIFNCPVEMDNILARWMK